MVQVRLTDKFRFVIIGAPEYLSKAGTPRTPPASTSAVAVGLACGGPR